MMMDRYVAQRRALIGRMQEKGIRDLEILRLFDMVPRHQFVPHAVAHRAYEDAAIPIGFGQTASQPSLQALYMQLLEISPNDRVLEIGTGSGFQTAVLAHLADRVYSIERIPELASRAREALDALRLANVALLVGDGTVGWSRYAPYDAILVAAAAPDVPGPLVDQLAEGGRMLVPVGGRDAQRLLMVRRQAGQITQEEVLDCTFVPLLGRFGWLEERGAAG
jgi:protein-L-isoaspartate(D-aspartate) O-methyltransferase